MSGVELRVRLASRGAGADKCLVQCRIDSSSKEHTVAAAQDGPAAPIGIPGKTNAWAKIGFQVIQLEVCGTAGLASCGPGKFSYSQRMPRVRLNRRVAFHSS